MSVPGERELYLSVCKTPDGAETYVELEDDSMLAIKGVVIFRSAKVPELMPEFVEALRRGNFTIWRKEDGNRVCVEAGGSLELRRCELQTQTRCCCSGNKMDEMHKLLTEIVETQQLTYEAHRAAIDDLQRELVDLKKVVTRHLYGPRAGNV